MARPKGSKNVKETQTIEPPRCPGADCGSTDGEVLGTTTQDFSGETPEGDPYNQIVRRRTICNACGRVRIDRSFEYVVHKIEPPTNVEDAPLDDEVEFIEPETEQLPEDAI